MVWNDLNEQLDNFSINPKFKNGIEKEDVEFRDKHHHEDINCHDKNYNIFREIDKLREQYHHIFCDHINPIEEKLHILEHLEKHCHNTIKRKELMEILNNYYTKSESERRFKVKPIAEEDIYKIGFMVFEEK